MTSKEYYKQTSDMAYRLMDAHVDEDAPHRVIANVFIDGGTTKDAKRILEANDFFSIPDLEDFEYDVQDGVELELRFHYGLDDFDVFRIDVCDVIDCTSVEGGRIVLSCCGYTLIHQFRPTKKENAETSDGEKPDAQAVEPVEDGCYRDFFDTFVNPFGLFSRWSPFSAIPNFGKLFSDAGAELNSRFEKFAKDGEGKYCRVSCNVDKNGNVEVKRTTNDGTVERKFKLSDVVAHGLENLLKEDNSVKLEVEDDGGKTSKSDKAQLKDLVK